MKTQVQTNLLGKYVKRSVATGDGLKMREQLFSISAIWICDTDSEPSVALTPCDKFGHLSAGAVVIDFLSNLVMA